MLILFGALVINVALIAIVVSFIKNRFENLIIRRGDASMANFASNPLFGIVLSIWAYLIGMLIFREYPHPITTPPLVTGNRYLILSRLLNFL